MKHYFQHYHYLPQNSGLLHSVKLAPRAMHNLV